MSFPKLEVGDLVLTETYSGQAVEVCQYRGKTGNLMYMIHHPDIMLKSHLERFIRDDDSMPSSVMVVRKTAADNYAKVLSSLVYNHENLNVGE